MRLPDVSKESLSHADDSETQSEEAGGEADVEGGRKAESREEDEMFRRQSGAMWSLFADGEKSRRYHLGGSPLSAVKAAGLLGPGTMVVHGVHLDPADLDDLAASRRDGQFGAEPTGDDVRPGARRVDEHARAQMKKILAEIQDGTFAREWIAEYQAGNPRYRALKQADIDHPIEQVGKKLRSAMSWLGKDGEPTAAAATPKEKAA